MTEYVAPEFEKEAFNCPFCGAYAQQKWYRQNDNAYRSDIYRVVCIICYEHSVWHKRKMIYPALSTAPLPHKDMPEIIKNDFSEARDILVKSPRGACALLRLALQKLCDELVEGNQNLNSKIGVLVDRGLSKQLQRAFDFVRITGNDAVHGIGDLNTEDNPEIAQALFKLINMIIEKMITEPKEVDDFYNLIPESKREAIEKRDCV